MKLLEDTIKLEAAFYKIFKDDSSWNELKEKFKESKIILICGNGGNLAVSNHAETDINRLLDSKSAFSPSNLTFITAASNDCTFENVFVEWVKNQVKPNNYKKKDILVLALSASGTSKNIIRLLDYLSAEKINNFLITAKNHPLDKKNLNVLNLDYSSYHLFEVACMMLIYELIRVAGGTLPTLD